MPSPQTRFGRPREVHSNHGGDSRLTHLCCLHGIRMKHPIAIPTAKEAAFEMDSHDMHIACSHSPSHETQFHAYAHDEGTVTRMQLGRSRPFFGKLTPAATLWARRSPARVSSTDETTAAGEAPCLRP